MNKARQFIAVKLTEPHKNDCCTADTGFQEVVAVLLLTFLPIKAANMLIMG